MTAPSQISDRAAPDRRPPFALVDREGRERERRLVRAGDGLDLAFAESGRGPPVVLLHGTLTTLEDMTISLGDALTPHHRVLAFDRPGFGRSTVRRFVDAGPWRQAQGLHRALDRLDVGRPVVVGHSFGASVALAMAMQRPDRIAGVVALAPLVRPEPRLEQALFGLRSAPFGGELVSAGARATVDRSMLPALWRAMFLPQAMPRRVEVEFPFALAARASSISRIGEDAFAAPADLVRLLGGAPSCRTPTRIFGGDRDMVVRNGLNGRVLAALMPEAVFHDLPGLGHMAHHFAAERIAAAVADLSAEGPSRAPAVRRSAT